MTFTLSGQLKEHGIIELDETPPIAPGPVTIHVQPCPQIPAIPAGGDTPEERKRRLLALAGSISDEDAQEMLAIIEREFEQVDPDEWR